jgi:serine/threonine protein kinase/class 3 adenylate cyclase
MKLGPYRLKAQLGAGRDGVAYEAAHDQDEAPAEVRVLAAARADADRWAKITRRLALLALLEHEGALRLRNKDLDHDPPFVALEWCEPATLAESVRGPMAVTQAVGLAHTLAESLLAAHRLGLGHGRLCPSAVQRSDRRAKIDFTRLDVGSIPAGPVDEACFPPEPENAATSVGPADVYGLGAVLYWLLTGKPAERSRAELALPGYVSGSLGDTPLSLSLLLGQMLAADPEQRPTLPEVCAALRGIQALGMRLEQTADAPVLAELGRTADSAPAAEEELGYSLARPPAVSGDELMRRGKLGRYLLRELLGQGGMGAVYRAEDSADGRTVAVKVLRVDHAAKRGALRRFHKEARLLAEVTNPYVTGLLDVNVDDGIHYLVLEYVAGRSLGALLREQGRLEETPALELVADVARALADAHDRGIVHRDIKPENVLLLEPDAPGARPRVKLSDFGLARHVVESASLDMTQAGSVLGTPLYMAPEQGKGSEVSPASDTYALGATLFHLLTGRPPFTATTALGLIHQHASEPPPPMQRLVPALSDGVCRLVEKTLAKSPDQRHANAGELLRDIERLLRGEPASITVHPRLPEFDPRRVVDYDWHWDLEASPRQLWPLISNTDRLNRAVGLPPIEFRAEAGGEKESEAAGLKPAVRRFGQLRKMGLKITWQEHPFEWVEGRRLGVLREFSGGPFRWLMTAMELEPRPGGGTRLTHKVRVAPRGMLGRTVAHIEIGVKGRRGVDRVYRRMDAALTGKLGSPALIDPFEEPHVLPNARRQRLEQLLDGLVEKRLEAAVVERFGDYLALAPAQEVARIRPLSLAKRLGLDPEQLVAACLHGARAGLLILMWDILCPLCRIPSEMQNTLRDLKGHGRCEACNLDFELDFANSVEMIFRAHPEIRDTELATYCVGGPAHSPHVAAQIRLAPGERAELHLELPEGAYRLRGPQLPSAFDFHVQPGAPTGRLEVNLAGRFDRDLPRLLRAGAQAVVLENGHGRELVVRIERTASRGDALTAARAAALGLFRDLFPDEILSSGQLIRVATVTLLVTELDRAESLYRTLGDGQAFAVIHEHFRLLRERIRREGGAVVKTVGEGLLAAFDDSLAAVRAALDMPALLTSQEKTKGLGIRLGIHRGPVLAATINDHLDYFGEVTHQVIRLPQWVGPGELVLTQAVAADPSVAAWLRQRGLRGELVDADLPGQPGAVLERLRAVEPDVQLSTTRAV